jgi:glycosyltransferase involved in cell wall biosynthesis
MVKKRYNAVMVKGARVIAVSEFVKEHILSTYRIDPGIIRTIPRGVDFTAFDDTKLIADRISQLTKSWGLFDNFSPVIFCPGRISRIKGQHVLVEALATMNDLPFLCIIAGSDIGHEDYRDELQDLIRERGLEGKVRLASSTNFMAEAYTLSNVVVVPSVQAESFGRVAIEAQAMGRLVIATDHGGARETIVNNETGYLVPPNDAEMMAAAIRFALARDEATVQAMSRFAQQHVRSNFNSERMKTDTIAVYRELLT